MRSNSFLIALPFLAFATPLAAQDVVFVSGTGDEIPVAVLDDDRPAIDDRGDDISDVADRMDDPLVQDGVSNTV